MKLIILGPPGTGKGTLSKSIKKNFGYKHISTGDLLRKEVAKESEIGNKVAAIMKRGELVSDEIVFELLKKKLAKLDSFILDGFPRKIEQARILDDFLEEAHISINLVVVVDSKQNEIVKRLSSRRQCKECGHVYGYRIPPQVEDVCDECGSKLKQRKDDAPDVVKERFAIYRKSTRPMINFYDKKGLVVRVDGNGTPDEVYSEIEKILKKHFGK